MYGEQDPHWCIFYDEDAHKFRDFNKDDFNKITLNNSKDILQILNNLHIFELFQIDDGIKTNFNDCWNDLRFFIRYDDHTSVNNNLNELYLPFLLNNEGNRLILPDSSFKIQFTYIASDKASLRLVNLKGSFLDIHLDDYKLKKGDNITILYNSGKVILYQNNEIIKKYDFILIHNKGYFTIRLPSMSSLSYKNFVLYKNDLTLSNLINETVEIKNQYFDMVDELKELKEDFNSFKNHTNEITSSTNFLFNNLYLDHEFTPKNLLKNVRSLSVELLSFVDNVCKKYDLDWWLDYGTLIGAIRHDGFIPWDDDVDIGMMRVDYNKFNEILLKEIKEQGLNDLIKVSYRKRNFNGQTVNAFIQIFILDETKQSKNTIFAGVDIFPYDFIADYNMDDVENRYDDVKDSFYTDLSKGNDSNSIYMGLNSDKLLQNYYSALNLKWDADYVVPGVEGACGPNNLYNLFIIKKTDLFPLKQHKYSEKLFPIPNNYDLYLKSIYGDYMSIPANIRTHGRVNNFRYDFKINEKFEYYEKTLKKANLKFN